jgi:Phosphoenolpyruvate phosphomutase
MHLTDGQRQLKFARSEVRTETRAMPSQNDKAMAFRALHERRGAFIMPNPWDAGTAKLLTALGFEALATTSLGLATCSAVPTALLRATKWLPIAATSSRQPTCR